MHKKKLLILSSYGGYGHGAAANALKSLLGHQYEIEIIYPIKELRIFGISSGEACYNFLIARNYLNPLTNILLKTPPTYIFRHRREKTRSIIQKHIEEKKPDLVISLIPLVNYPASEAARLCSTPFLIITIDHDLHIWAFELEKIQHPHFKVTIGDDLPTSKGKLLEHRVPKEAIETIGLPLRPEFTKAQNKELLRKKYQLPENKPVLLIMMGGVGGRSTLKYVKKLNRSLENLHFIVCTGRNKKLAQEAYQIAPLQGNSIQVMSFTEHVHELFAVADLLITKPGPGTLNEAFSQKLPILIDYTSVPIYWEKVNIDLVVSKKVGSFIPSFEKAPELVRQFLYDEQLREEVARAYRTFAPNQFGSKIKHLIEELCPEVLSGEVVMTSRNITPLLSSRAKKSGPFRAGM